MLFGLDLDNEFVQLSMHLLTFRPFSKHRLAIFVELRKLRLYRSEPESCQNGSDRTVRKFKLVIEPKVDFLGAFLHLVIVHISFLTSCVANFLAIYVLEIFGFRLSWRCVVLLALVVVFLYHHILH